MTIQFEIEPRGAYSLEASASFLCGFSPASGSACRADGGMTFGFGLDGAFDSVAAKVEARAGRVLVTAVGTTEVEAVRGQVSRILSLDHDGAGWSEVGARDPVIGALMRQYEGVRPVCFYSPYEAACWGILAARTPMRVAARTRVALADALGGSRVVAGDRVQVFPSPSALLAAKTIPFVPEIKAARLRGIATAALEGELDARLLAAMGSDEARIQLRRLAGVGEWTASHVLVRGVGLSNEPAFYEPRVRAGFKLAYGFDHDPTDAELLAASERWRPYRTWVSVLLAVHLSRSGGWDDVPRRSKRVRKHEARTLSR